jgi:hypothetical protein
MSFSGRLSARTSKSAPLDPSARVVAGGKDVVVTPFAPFRPRKATCENRRSQVRLSSRWGACETAGTGTSSTLDDGQRLPGRRVRLSVELGSALGGGTACDAPGALDAGFGRHREDLLGRQRPREVEALAELAVHAFEA